MVRKLVVPAILLEISLFLHQPASAQDGHNPWKYKVEVSGNIAHGSVYNGDHLLGKGLDCGGGLAVRPFSGFLRRLSFDVQMARLHGDRPPQETLSSRLTAVTGSWHFRPDSRVQPYAFGGLGRMHSRYTRSCDTCVYERAPGTGPLIPVPYYWEMKGAKNGLVLGGGIRIGLRHHLSFRPEFTFMDTTPGSGPNWSWLRFAAVLGFNF
jgi:hypothetical protein